MTKEAEVFGTKDQNLSSCCNNPQNTCYIIHLYKYIFHDMTVFLFCFYLSNSLNRLRGFVWKYHGLVGSRMLVLGLGK